MSKKNQKKKSDFKWNAHLQIFFKTPMHAMDSAPVERQERVNKNSFKFKTPIHE
jgi:hypothetical protein